MKIRQILSIGCFLWILASLRLAAQQPEIQPLPIDPKIRYGQLNNGLTYYIRHNAQPKDRADFFIAQCCTRIRFNNGGAGSSARKNQESTQKNRNQKML